MAEDSDNLVVGENYDIPEPVLTPIGIAVPEDPIALPRASCHERVSAAATLTKISDKPLKQPSTEKVIKSENFRVNVLVNGEIHNVPISTAVNSHMLITGKDFPKYSDKLKNAIQNPDQYNIEDPNFDTMNEFLNYVLIVEQEITNARNFAREDRAVLSKIINGLGNETGVSDSNIHAKEPIKGFSRSVSKAISYDEYNGDWTRIRDYTRGALVYSNVEDVVKCIELLKSPKYSKYYREISIQDRLTYPSAGEKSLVRYRDVNISMRLQSGRVVELQLHLDKLFEAQKNGRVVSRDYISEFSEDDFEYLKLYAPNATLFTPVNKDNIKIKTHDIYEIIRALVNHPSRHSSKIMLKLRQLETSINEAAWQEYLTQQ